VLEVRQEFRCRSPARRRDRQHARRGVARTRDRLWRGV